MTAAIRFCAATTVALLMVCAAARPAAAHTALTGSSPAAGATVGPPGQIVLTFTDPVRFAQVVVVDASGRHYESGRPSMVDATVTQKLAPSPDGPLTVAWRVVAPDGHPVAGRYRFTVTGSTVTSAPATRPPTSAPAPATRDRGGDATSTAGRAVAAGGVVVVMLLVAAGGAVWLRRRRATGPPAR